MEGMLISCVQCVSDVCITIKCSDINIEEKSSEYALICTQTTLQDAFCFTDRVIYLHIHNIFAHTHNSAASQFMRERNVFKIEKSGIEHFSNGYQ